MFKPMEYRYVVLCLCVLAGGCGSEPPRSAATARDTTAPSIAPGAPDSGTGSPAAQRPDPWIERTDSGPLVHLPAAMERALRREFPSFRPWLWTSYPAEVQARYQGGDRDGVVAVVGDFNGDGRLDIALDGGYDRTAASGRAMPTVAILALLSNGDSAIAVGVTEGSLTPGDTAGVPRERWLRLVPAKSFRPTQLTDAIGVPSLSLPRKALLPKQVFIWDARADRPRFLQWFDGE